MFYSQPMTCEVPICGEEANRKDVIMGRLRDKLFHSFKAWSGRSERQLIRIIGNSHESEPDINIELESPENHEAFPVDHFFDALSGPELDTLRDSKELVLPKDKTWPFLLRFPISAFGICLKVSSQAILWKTLAISPSTKFLNISPVINHALWFIAITALATFSFIYIFKIIFYFEAVIREYYPAIRVNFFFAPWVACLFLAFGLPLYIIPQPRPKFIWYMIMAPIFCLQLKIYGQWTSGRERRLSQEANPSNQLAMAGNFVGALLGTQYQRLPTNETLPKELHPVFFLFVAPPSVASIAWATIQGEFGYGSRISYFTALFRCASLAIRLNFFRFSLAWWACTFPMTRAAVPTIKYANEVQSPATQILSGVLSAIAAITVADVLLTTLFHAFVLQDLFPNDNMLLL